MAREGISSVNTISFLMVIWIFATVFLAGCGKQRPTDERNELAVLCGSSFVKPTEKFAAFLSSERSREILMKHNYRTDPP